MAESKYEEEAPKEPKGCACEKLEPPKKYPHPGPGQSIRRLIKAIEEELEKQYEPTTATKAFADELKDADKEYQGLDQIVSDYRKYYDKLECGPLTEARKWKNDLSAWCKEKVEAPIQDNIKELRRSYDKLEKEACCEWLRLKDLLFRLDHCLGQAARKVDETKEDYEAYKAFEKTLTGRFAELKSLYEKAVKLRGEGKHQAVCAVELEYNELFDQLFAVFTWDYQRGKCSTGGASQPAAAARKGPPPDKTSPEKFKEELTKALHILIEARYQHFRWKQDQLVWTANRDKNKAACDKVRGSRREEFIQEAQDVKPDDKSTPPPTYQQQG